MDKSPTNYNIKAQYFYEYINLNFMMTTTMKTMIMPCINNSLLKKSPLENDNIDNLIIVMGSTNVTHQKYP